MKPREAVYIAHLASMKGEHYVVHSLVEWQRRENPSQLDFAFALEIASGTTRMALALDYIGAELSTTKKLNLKLKEKALLRIALYQICFMTKVPLYAVVNETVEIAKKHCHSRFSQYLNALLRQLEKGIPTLPSGSSAKEMSIRYSYPVGFVIDLLMEYGTELTEQILESGNTTPKLMVRMRSGKDIEVNSLDFLSPMQGVGLPIGILKKATALAAITSLPEVYIQNATPVSLVAALSSRTRAPKRVLDLCASPGGKLLAVHDLFLEAELYANDVSMDKVNRLSENLSKYGVNAHVSCGPGELYQSDLLYDLIILDVPCSNSGVLNKRVEARWRLSVDKLDALRKVQMSLLNHARTLLAPNGVIWYMTCSILKRENEELVRDYCEGSGMKIEYSKLVVPNSEGWDGGFAAILTI